MVFGVNYDISLWLILKSDSKNRNIILNFIKSIPNDIYKEILFIISEYQKGVTTNLYREFKFKDMIYFFRLTKEDGSIRIGSSSKKVEDNDIFLLKIYPFNSDDVVKSNSFIGEFIYQIKDQKKGKITDCDSISYKIVRFLSNLYISNDSDYLYPISNIFRKLETDKIPTYIDIKTLETDSFKYRLGKRRTKQNVDHIKKF